MRHSTKDFNIKQIADAYVVGSKVSERGDLLKKIENAKKEGKKWKVKKLQAKLKNK